MIIGILKERLHSERRVALTPGGVHSLTGLGATVYVEHGAGLLSFFSDEEYQHAGATIVYSPEEIMNRSDVVLKISSPSEQDLDMLRGDQTLFSALHLPLAKRQVLEILLNKNITAIGYEVLENDRGEVPMMQSMSEIAGQISIQVAAYYLQSQYGGRGVLLGGIPGVRAATVVILGGGTAGRTAARVALGLGAKVTMIDRSIPKLRELEDLFQWRVATVIADPYTIARELRGADVLIGAVLLKGERTPHLVSEEMVKSMKPGSVIVDLSIDHGGCVETSRPTTLTDPIFIEHHIVHYCVPNIPASVPRTATVGWTNVTLPFLRQAVELGMEQVLHANVGLSRGVCTFRGKCTNNAVAKAFDVPFYDIRAMLE
jgi:alanine dehydrogenase